MTTPRRWPSALVLAYPPGWRARYGDELEVLITDMQQGGRKPVPMAADLLRGAATAWYSVKKGFAMSERSRGALYTVLWSWVAFAAATAWFGHDLIIYPTRQVALLVATANPGVPDSARILIAAGVVGGVVTAIAAVVFAIGAVRYARAHGRRRIYLLMAIPPVSAVVWLGGLKLLPAGALTMLHAGLAIIWVLVGVALIAVSTQAVVTITRTAELDERTWRIGGVTASVIVAAMLVATGATITWGLLQHSSQLHTGPQSGWVLTTVIMVVTTARAAIALIGSRRSGQALTEQPATA
jgi:hypothetical protein